MTQIQINKAYPALKILSEMKLPVKKAYKVYTVLKSLETQYEFSIEQERKLFEKYEGVINKDGTVSFPNGESFRSFQEELSELNNFEVDMDIESISLSDIDLNEQTITASVIYNLEGFVSFE